MPTRSRGYSSTQPTPNPAVQPIILASQGLTQTLTVIGGSWSVLELTHPVAVIGTLQFRLVFICFGATASDVIGAKLVNPVGPADLTAEATTTATDANATMVTTAWTNMPGSHTSCYVYARNQTAVRGTAATAWLEFRFA